MSNPNQRSLTIKPVRVFVGEGCALPPRMAFSRYKVRPTIVFVRDDNWTLGANEDGEQEAFKLWQESWVSFQREAEEVQHISKFKRKEQ